MQLLRLVFDNLRRNLFRTCMTAVASIILVLVVTGVLSILAFLESVTQEKSQNFKALVTEKWRMPSQMPFSYAAALEQGNYRREGDARPADSMTWSIFFGSIAKDPKKRTVTNEVFAFCMEPVKIKTMLDDTTPDKLTPEQQAELYPLVDRLQQTRQGIILGRDRWKALEKELGTVKIGDRLTLYSRNYQDLEMEVEILGVFPEKILGPLAVMHRDFLIASLDAYQRKNRKAHPQADKALNIVWLRVPDQPTFQQIATQIVDSGDFSSPALKVETLSSGISLFFDAYRDLLWYFRWVLSPAILAIISLVISIAISISVRERRMEFAVLKVLGFRESQLMLMVLLEAGLIGLVAGTVSSWGLYGVINLVYGGLRFPVAFFRNFDIPADALWWGPAIGISAALVGSLIPAWNAQRVKVAEVFSRVT